MIKQNAAFIIAIGLILSALVFGLFFYNARQTIETIRVVGYANQEFNADIVKWSFSFSQIVELDGLKQGYNIMNSKLEKFKSIWNTLDISEEEMNIQPITVRKNYGQYGKINGYVLEQSFYILTKDLDKIKNITINPKKFTDNDIAFESSQLQYFSTKLPQIKKELLGAATKNAMERVQEIASSCNKKVGEIQSAKSGVFQITEPYSTEISSYGMYQTSTSKKNIKVTVSAVFSIK